MKKYQKEFTEFLIDERALQFGRFELKSRRISPYFFNTLPQFWEDCGKTGVFLCRRIFDICLSAQCFRPGLQGIALPEQCNRFNPSE